jgi:hypothetical protein
VAAGLASALRSVGGAAGGDLDMIPVGQMADFVKQVRAIDG